MKTLAATTEKASIKNRILVVDDDEQIRDILQMRLEADGYDVDCLGTIPEALKCVGRHEYSLVLLDIRVGAGNGVESLPLFRQQNADVPIFIITAHGDVDSAVRAFSRGANGYIRKPFQEGELKHQIAAAVESYRTKLEAKRLRGRSTALQAETLDKIIISRDPAMKPVLKQIQMAAGNNSNLVVQGASGTGKELVARALHTLSARKQGPFIAINCGAFPETLLESELFGYVKGAFTDARTDKAGHIISANGGTLFLDEIGDAPLSIQVRLLRILQEREVTPLGSSTPIKVDVRFIAATHRDLKSLVAEGKFREDLFYRLQVISLHIPLLKDRPQDIVYLAEIFAAKIGAVDGGTTKKFTAAAVAAAEAYPWPGNVRELQNRVERAVVMGAGNEIDVIDIFPELATTERPAACSEAQTDQEVEFVRAFNPGTGKLPPYKEAKEQFERLYVETLLRQAGGNIAQAARLAGKARTEIYTLLRKHGMNADDYKDH